MAARGKSPFSPTAFLAKVGEGRRHVKHQKGDIIFSQGEPARSVFFIQEGKVKLTVVSEQGKEAVVAILAADDFFGEGCLAAQRVRISTATAMTECDVMCIESSTRAKDVSRGCSCCWPISARRDLPPP